MSYQQQEEEEDWCNDGIIEEYSYSQYQQQQDHMDDDDIGDNDDDEFMNEIIMSGGRNRNNNQDNSNKQNVGDKQIHHQHQPLSLREQQIVDRLTCKKKPHRHQVPSSDLDQNSKVHVPKVPANFVPICAQIGTKSCPIVKQNKAHRFALDHRSDEHDHDDSLRRTDTLVSSGSAADYDHQHHQHQQQIRSDQEFKQTLSRAATGALPKDQMGRVVGFRLFSTTTRHQDNIPHGGSIMTTQQRQEAQDESECTFHPDISDFARDELPDRSPERLVNELSADEKRRQHLQSLRNDKMCQFSQECTFMPEIAPVSELLSQKSQSIHSSGGGNSNDNISSSNVCNRLYRDAADKEARSNLRRQFIDMWEHQQQHHVNKNNNSNTNYISGDVLSNNNNASYDDSNTSNNNNNQIANMIPSVKNTRVLNPREERELANRLSQLHKVRQNVLEQIREEKLQEEQQNASTTFTTATAAATATNTSTLKKQQQQVSISSTSPSSPASQNRKNEKGREFLYDSLGSPQTLGDCREVVSNVLFLLKQEEVLLNNGEMVLPKARRNLLLHSASTLSSIVGVSKEVKSYASSSKKDNEHKKLLTKDIFVAMLAFYDNENNISNNNNNNNCDWKTLAEFVQILSKSQQHQNQHQQQQDAIKLVDVLCPGGDPLLLHAGGGVNENDNAELKNLGKKLMTLQLSSRFRPS